MTNKENLVQTEKGIVAYFKRMKIPTKEEMDNYFPRYLMAHQKPWTRRIHLMGQVATLVAIIFCLSMMVAFHSLFWLIMVVPSLTIPYLFAFPSHRYIEKNVAETFKVNPVLTRISDLKMCYQMIIGKIKF